MARVDYDRMAPAYDAGRGRTLDQLRPWREALAEFLPQPCGCRSAILDLGAGTGQWAAALSRWFELSVVAVEPSAGMRAAAAAKDLGRVLLVAGRGEAIPLAAGACSAAWLSLMLHHLDDPARCAEELHRVLCPHGLVLLRGAFPDAGELLDLSLLLRFFPGAKRVLASFPRLDDTVAMFERAGFALVATRGVADLAAVSLRDALGRIRLRADTVLRQLPDAAFHQGLRQLELAAAAEDPKRPPAPLYGRLPLVVLAKTRPEATSGGR
ncbi:MAG TPA: class I SAM-dependent methyltransferase [Actinomycetes bacterium]